MHISNNHLEKDVVILPDLWEVTFFTCMTIFHAKMHLLRNFATRHTDVFVLTFTVYVQGVQEQNLPKEIGITKKLCTSDP